MVEIRWRKSTFSGGNDGGNCVEVADLDDGSRLVRHSADPNGDVLHFSASEWSAFLRGCAAGEFGTP